MDIDKTVKALKRNRYHVSVFDTAVQAADYLDRELDGEVIGFGDSKTMIVMDLYKRLSAHNEVHDPNHSRNNDEFLRIAKECLTTDIYLTSVNAMSETGEMVNIDGTGNRIAGSLFGHEKVYFIAGTNKIEPDLEKAIWRARNIAAPLNSKKYDLQTPCVIKGDKCYDCASPDRICNAMTIYMKKMNDIEDVEVILIKEELGF
ncbi:MAG: lactate utilization protein [Eubacteriaceae bacterium]|nr:lactate utilization protein [Eubacteriaceae bacterium]